MSDAVQGYYFVVPALVAAEEGEEVGGARSAVLDETRESGHSEGISISAAADEGGRKEARRKVKDHRRRRGEVNEVRFCLDAMEQDYICGKPLTAEAFDVFTVPRSARKRKGKPPRRVAIVPVKRVQVRSTDSVQMQKGGKTPYYRITTKHAFDRRRYTADEIDIIAAYIAPLRLWYIIPFSEIGTASSISLFPHDTKSKGKYEKFRERWDLLAE